MFTDEGFNRQEVFLKGIQFIFKIILYLLNFCTSCLGRHKCNCQASKHGLINNCVSCGRIVCKQEGSGPCIVCGELV